MVTSEVHFLEQKRNNYYKRIKNLESDLKLQLRNTSNVIKDSILINEIDALRDELNQLNSEIIALAETINTNENEINKYTRNMASTDETDIDCISRFSPVEEECAEGITYKSFYDGMILTIEYVEIFSNLKLKRWKMLTFRASADSLAKEDFVTRRQNIKVLELHWLMQMSTRLHFLLALSVLSRNFLTLIRVFISGRQYDFSVGSMEEIREWQVSLFLFSVNLANRLILLFTNVFNK
uniref:Uncharacterized protein n=1 Tax=Strigamia maritima TaxID=126957 RepID=T1JE79_STRMM